MRKVALGIDFGTESVRALLVDLASGEELGTSESAYEHGVMDERLWTSSEALPADWAIQDPDDYLVALCSAVRGALASSGVEPAEVRSIGVDSTACTVIPAASDLGPLSRRREFRDSPFAYAKLWKDHSGQACAASLNAAFKDVPGLLEYYGGALSPEWMLPKALFLFREAPDVFRAASKLIEQEDWIVSQLVGHEVRGAQVAGYKATYRSTGAGYPSAEQLDAVEPGFSAVVEKLGSDFLSPGAQAGELVSDCADKLGLIAGTPVAVGNMDAQVALLGAGVAAPGTLVAVMGTSVCDLIVDQHLAPVRGIQGVVRDGIIPGYWGYEAGQAGVGDTFGWFVRKVILSSVSRPQATVRDVFSSLEAGAASLAPGASGMLALEWMNGNRSVLIDAGLSGMMLGMTLTTSPVDMYRALLEAATMGQRIIFEAFESQGVSVDRVVACGGMAKRSPLLMQILADVTDRNIEVAASSNTPALGAALHGAIAAGLVDTWERAASLVSRPVRTFAPEEENRAAFDEMFEQYKRVHDFFGIQAPEIMHSLRRTRAQYRAQGIPTSGIN